MNEILIKDLEEKVMVKATKNVKRYISDRKKAIAYWFSDQAKMEELVTTSGLNTFEISKHFFTPLIQKSRVVKRYDPIELLIVLDFYQEVLIELNKYTTYPPRLEQYCRLLGISTFQFKMTYLNSNDDEERNAAQQVIDYVSDALNFGGMTRQLDNQAQIFAQKSSLNKRDNDQPVVNNNNNTLIITQDEFKKKLEEISK